MEAIFKKRIEAAFISKEFIKIIFQYPAAKKAIIKRGVVTSIGSDGFELEEILDGLVTYSYKFITEIKGEGEKDEM